MKKNKRKRENLSFLCVLCDLCGKKYANLLDAIFCDNFFTTEITEHTEKRKIKKFFSFFILYILLYPCPSC